eukprot:TRINITY_DN88719_c0_g1_i1.p1 TRINITY_DN88719_c0_g1~~TRINITY_DN88719_c0_g1_i1.p1  ORF type:complete len:446 (-),score=19.51 TRINITY_DN88719_c0_g1_i1:79-1386(-)
MPDGTEGERENMVGASDESFYLMCFTFISVFLFFAYLPTVFNFLCCRKKNKMLEQREKMLEWPPRLSVLELLTFSLSSAFTLLRNPSYLVTGIQTLVKRPTYTRKIVLPIFLKNVIRIRLCLVAVWFLLLSIVMYQTLTFDAHAVLGIPKDADTKAVKKAYRRLSMQLHPDKNKTDAAKREYVQVRKAFKMLSDPEAFEKEMEDNRASGSVQVGIGLPSWMFDPKYRGFVALALFSLLFGVPGYCVYLATRSTTQIILGTVDNLPWLAVEYEYFFSIMGEPPVADPDNPPSEQDLVVEWRKRYSLKGYQTGQYFIETLTKYIQTKVLVPLIRHHHAGVPHLNSLIALVQSFQQQNTTKLENLKAISNEIEYQQNLHKNLVRQFAAPNKKLVKIIQDIQERNFQMPGDEDDCCGPPQQRPGSPKQRPGLTPKKPRR